MNKILTDFLLKVCDKYDWQKEDIEKLLDKETFDLFIEDNEDLRDLMYEAFRTLLDKYVSFRFYNDPIPALTMSPKYMEKRKQKIESEATNFFNFGGF